MLLAFRLSNLRSLSYFESPTEVLHCKHFFHRFCLVVAMSVRLFVCCLSPSHAIFLHGPGRSVPCPWTGAERPSPSCEANQTGLHITHKKAQRFQAQVGPILGNLKFSFFSTTLFYRLFVTILIY